MTDAESTLIDALLKTEVEFASDWDLRIEVSRRLVRAVALERGLPARVGDMITVTPDPRLVAAEGEVPPPGFYRHGEVVRGLLIAECDGHQVLLLSNGSKIIGNKL